MSNGEDFLRNEALRDEIAKLQRQLSRTADEYLQSVIRKEIAALRTRIVPIEPPKGEQS
jgi:hypothetical protein